MDRPVAAYLHMLPFELWLACWISCSRRQLRRLSLVCRRFRSVCLPLLLEHQRADVGALAMNIAEHTWLDHVHHLHRIAVRLDKLAEAPRVLMVKSWKVTSASSLPREWVPPGAPRAEVTVSRADVFDSLRDRVITTFSAKLGLYKNLISLEMQGIVFDARARNTLAALPRFQELTLDSCYIVPRDGVLLKLQKFTICGPPGTALRTGDDIASQHSLTMVSPTRIVQLELHAGGEIPPLIVGFGRTPLPCLVNLSLHDPPNFDLLLNFLKQCPQLESLVIKLIAAPSFASPRGHLDPDAVPLLRNLTAPAKLIGLFTPNRPIGAVTVLSDSSRDDTTSAEDFKNIFMAISHASLPLRSLSISHTSSILETSADITAIFPELRSLSMAVPEKEFPPFRRMCGGCFGGGPYFSEDASTLELEDEAAFDDPPTEEISDFEDDPRARPWSKPTGPKFHNTIFIPQNHPTQVLWSPPPLELVNQSYHVRIHLTSQYRRMALTSAIQKFRQHLHARSVFFPPELEALRLRVPFQVGHYYSDEHDELVAALSRQYPLLREVTMEYSFSESVWEILGADSYRKRRSRR
ncbi:hypothetical protein B0H19DRAFT_1263628 [Mycena capillaripes]|nr:hypothetical protein B0H19DRAFT_1263628 [Mycena capillaripes]